VYACAKESTTRPRLELAARDWPRVAAPNAVVRITVTVRGGRKKVI